MGLKPAAYIAIEGPIGAGKTTLARKLAEHYGARLLLERPEDNPFLPRFYREPGGAALLTQLSFLLQRAGQVESLHQRDLFAERWITDFLFDKDHLFAELTLAHADYELYLSVFRRLAWEVPPPELVIYLHAPLQLLQLRIEGRGRDYERGLSGDYLERLSLAYARYFRDYRAAPVLEVDAASFDPIGDPDHFAQLLQAVDAGGPGRLPSSTLL